MSKVISIQTGIIQTYEWQGKAVESAAFKSPRHGAVFLGKLGLEGDRQAEEKYHGGVDKAAYLYPIEYYPIWENLLGRSLEPGSLGENVLTEGLLDEKLHPGDSFQMGKAIIKIVHPRIPCFKVGMRLNNEAITAKFIKECKYGTYVSVEKEGYVQKGDSVTLIKSENISFTIKDMATAYAFPKENIALLESILNWKDLQVDLREDYERFHKRYA